MRQEPWLRPGDIVFTRGRSLLSRLIRATTRTVGESRTMANHVGLISVGGTVYDAEAIEALATVKEHHLLPEHADDDISVYRHKGITPSMEARVVSRAGAYVGAKYGPLKLALHLGDWLLGGAYIFRRLGRLDRYPICSWVVAFAWDQVGVRFGVHPRAASPDDIWDWVTLHPETWECVRPMAPVEPMFGQD